MKEIKADEILDISTKAGIFILESGGETYRTEDTIVNVARSMGAKKASAFVTPTVIMVTCCDENNTYHSITERITNRSVNLKKIALINAFSRKLSGREKPSNPLQVQRLLDIIDKTPSYPSWLITLASGFCAGFNLFMFGGTWQEALTSFVISVILRLFLIYIRRFGIANFLISLLSGLLIAFFSELAQLLKIVSSSGPVITAVLILVVPGLATVNAVRDIIAGDLVSGNARLTEAFMTATGISIGTAFGVSLLPI